MSRACRRDRPVVVGEVDLHGSFVAGARPGQLLLEARDQPARTELEQLISPLAALERLAVDPAQVVHHDVIAGLGRALHRVERCEAVAQPLELLVDRALIDLRLTPPDLEPFVVAELRLRTNPDLDRELQGLTGLGKLAKVELGLPYGADPGLVDRVRVPGAERASQRLVEHGLAPEPADHDRRRNLALAEARHPHLPAELAGRLLKAALHLLGGDLGLDAHSGFGKLGDGCFDG